MKRKESKESLSAEQYNRIYNLITILGIVIVIPVWYFTNDFWGLIALCFGIWSLLWYNEGAHRDVIDEFEYAYPKDGFRLMFKSWPWFIPVAIVAYVCCKQWMPYLFE